MVFSRESFEEMVEDIQFQKAIRSDYIVPAEYPDCPQPSQMIAPYDFQNPPLDSKELLPNSDLWIQFLQHVYHGPFEIIDHFNEQAGLLGPRRAGEALLCRALENAFYHGNQNNPLLPVSLKVFEGTKGMVIRIRDSGQGFDVDKVINIVSRLQKQDPAFYLHPQNHTGEDRYFRRRGGGFGTYALHPSPVSFENNGSIINIKYRFPANM